MKRQLKFLILTCSTLTFSGCDPLHHTEKVRRQQSQLHRSTQPFKEVWQLLTSGKASLFPAPSKWKNTFLPHPDWHGQIKINDRSIFTRTIA